MNASELWDRARNAFLGLEPRERMLVSAAGGLLAIALLYLLVIAPLLSALGGGDERVASADQQARVMAGLRHEYDEVQGRLTRVEERIRSGPRGNLRTTLETLARQATVRVETMEPQATPSHPSYRETKVEVGLRGVTLSQTVNYLHQIESAPQALSIKSLRIRRRPEQDLLDVTFTVSAFEPT